MTALITATIVIGSLLSPVVAATPTAASHRIYLPIVMSQANTWPIPRPTPTPRVVPMDFPLESVGFAHYYSPDGQRWNFYTDVTMSPLYQFTASDMVMLAFKGLDSKGDVLYENMGQHAADPSWVHPGGTTRIEWDAPDVPRGIWGIWFMLRWR